MLPMGTIMTGCMLLGLLFAARPTGIRRLPEVVQVSVGTLVFAGGAWNVFWHALRHVPEFWGNMALASGLLMMIAGVSIARPSALPEGLQRARPFWLLLLLACFVQYGWTIYHL